VLAAYAGIVDTLIVDTMDAADAMEAGGVRVVALDTRIAEPGPAAALAKAILAL
jgi:hypothetical protein